MEGLTKNIVHAYHKNINGCLCYINTETRFPFLVSAEMLPMRFCHLLTSESVQLTVSIVFIRLCAIKTAYVTSHLKTPPLQSNLKIHNILYESQVQPLAASLKAAVLAASQVKSLLGAEWKHCSSGLVLQRSARRNRQCLSVARAAGGLALSLVCQRGILLLLINSKPGRVEKFQKVQKKNIPA